jgi:hypothetical protein
LRANPGAGVEFPVILKGLFRPHYPTWPEQTRIGEHAPAYPRNAIRIVTETGPRVYREFAPLKKEQVDLTNQMVFIADSKTPAGVAEAPLTDIVVAAPAGRRIRLRTGCWSRRLGIGQPLDSFPRGLPRQLLQQSSRSASRPAVEY